MTLDEVFRHVIVPAMGTAGLVAMFVTLRAEWQAWKENRWEDRWSQ